MRLIDRRQPASPDRRLQPAFLLLLLLPLLLLSGCGNDGKPQEAPPRSFTDPEYVAAFHRGVSELEQHRFVEAAQTFDELTRSRSNLVAPWINLASAQLNRNVEAAHPLCIAATERATALDPKAPQPYFLRGILFKHLGRFPEAEKNFREALEHAPDDPAALYHLSSLVVDRDLAEATRLLEKAIEGETHLSSAYYTLMGVKRRTDRTQLQDLLEIFKAFEASNTGNKMNIVYTEMGRLGEAVRDLPIAAESRPAGGRAAKFEFSKPVEVQGQALTITYVDERPLLLSQDGDYVVAFTWKGDGLSSEPTEMFADRQQREESPSIVPGDFDGDGRDDLALADGNTVRLMRLDGNAFRQLPHPVLGADPPDPILGAGYGNCLWSDLDQDGDLDLVAWKKTKVVFLVNRRDGKFEATESKPATTRPGFQPPPLPTSPKGINQVVTTDLDGDGDPDLLIASDEGLRLWRNDRLMRFTDVTNRAGLAGSGKVESVLVSDVDGDRFLDIVAAPATVFRHVSSGAFRLTFAKQDAKGLPGPPVAIGDLDSDGRDEVVVRTESGLSIHAIDDLLGAAGPGIVVDTGGKPGRSMLADLNGDMALDLIVTTPSGTRVYPGKKPPQNHALEIRLKGRTFANTMHSNMGGIGARVEVMAGNRSQVRELRSGDPPVLHFGLGPNANADYVRIVWPDDVLQSEGWVPGDQLKVIEEFQRKASSCPILFAWNGERFECVTDFLGVGGLGFFIEPGVYGPPDPTEQILIPRLEPRNGKLEVRIHEPFEEIAYLDVARLIVVDTPADVDVVPDERFAINAPQPDGKLLVIRERIDPVAARDGRDEDVLEQVLKSDRKQAHAFADPRFLGYAEKTTFALDFGSRLAQHAGSDRLYLGLDGWVEYPYSHINLAAFQAGVRLEAMSIEVEVEGSGFVRIQNEACYPAGMPRIMTLPLGKLPEKMTGKLRLVTNQELWIDRLFLFEPAGDVPLPSRTLQATSAELRASGFPREYSPDGIAPRLYDYDIRDPSFPWKTMAGTYTAFGEVAELLREPDDCYVVFGGGEEIVLTFDPPPPPGPGMKRTYVLDTFGWCKDMDPLTAYPYTVEPLPFRGMSNYPYGPTESFPDGEAQRRWRAQYQTRTMPGTRAR
jgi:tetratricopeptide (TPR) repeat protein